MSRAQRDRFAWGVDPAASGFAIAVVSDPGIGPRTGALHVVEDRRAKAPKGGSNEARMATVARLAGETMADLLERFPPSVIVVEQPVGRFPKPTLMGAWGALTCAAVMVAGEATVWMTPPEWKKAAGLPGNCGKPEAGALAAGLGYDGTNIDESDAVCIAWAGLSRLTGPALIKHRESA